MLTKLAKIKTPETANVHCLCRDSVTSQGMNDSIDATVAPSPIRTSNDGSAQHSNVPSDVNREKVVEHGRPFVCRDGCHFDFSSVIDRYRIRSAVLPFPASGIVPSTTTVLPTTELELGAEPDSGTNCSTSLEPETRSATLSPAMITTPETVAVESFIVNPFLAMASFNCLSVSRVAWFHLYDGQSLFEADVNRIDAGDRFQGHAHGVCTDLSIHAENLDVNRLDFRRQPRKRVSKAVRVQQTVFSLSLLINVGAETADS